MRPPDAPTLERGRVVVCVIDDGRHRPDAAELMEMTAPEVALLRIGLSELADLTAATGDADVVLLDPNARVPGGWIERLRAPASSDATVGTVTPLGDQLLRERAGHRAGLEPDRMVRDAAADSRPRLLIGGPHCLYVPRRTVQLIGGLPSAPPTLAAAMAEISSRCVGVGLVNVLADDLYVSGEGSVAGVRPVAADVTEPDAERSALARSVRIAEAAIDGLSVTIDARSLGPAVGGTQRYTLDLLLALASFSELRLRAVVAGDIDPAVADQLRASGRVELITYAQALAGVALSHVVHRPQQVFSTADLNLLALLGRRVVVTHQDLIAYHNPLYHESREVWAVYRRVTRQALAIADRVIFFSDHSRHDAVAEDLVRVQRSQIVGAAVFGAGEGADAPPPPFPDEYILCLGSDYRHKNRPFAIAVAACLRADHGWGGTLVLAGPHVAYGSSRPEEQALLHHDPVARDAVLDLGSVSEARRDWLLTHARAVIVPSVVEGFGLVPLEAAQAGVPCLFAPQPPLTEVIDASLATLIAWEPQLSAGAVLPLLSDGPARERHLKRLAASARRWSWEEIATALVACYREAMRSPYRLATEQVLHVVRHEHRYQEIERRYTELGDRVALASDDGFLRAAEQRGLLRVGSRPALARATLWPFAVLGSLPRPARRR